MSDELKPKPTSVHSIWISDLNLFNGFKYSVESILIRPHNLMLYNISFIYNFLNATKPFSRNSLITVDRKSLRVIDSKGYLFCEESKVITSDKLDEEVNMFKGKYWKLYSATNPFMTIKLLINHYDMIAIPSKLFITHDNEKWLVMNFICFSLDRDANSFSLNQDTNSNDG